MVVPSFAWGLYAPDRLDAHPWCIALGATISSFYVILVYFLYIAPARNMDPVPIEAGVTGFVIQVFVIAVSETIRRLVVGRRDEKPFQQEQDGVQILQPGRPIWDLPHLARFGDHALTPTLLNKLMYGVREQVRNIWFTVLFLLALSFTTPLVPEFEPPLQADGTWLWLPAVVNGLPW